MRERLSAAVIGMVALAVLGCSGPGETLRLSLDGDAAPAPEKVNTPLNVAVVPFEDLRADKGAIGRYAHYVGTSVDTVVSGQGSAAEQITAFVEGYLKRAGFQVTRVDSASAAGSADVVLSGQIESYWSEAVGEFARTKLTTRNRLVVKIANAADGSSFRTALNAEDTASIVFFEFADLEKVTSASLGDSLSNFLSHAQVTGRSLTYKK